MKYFNVLLIIGFVVFSSCSPRLTPFTQELYEENGWTVDDLERIQFTKVDAIMTADLVTGRVEAKERRKQLTKNITVLLDRVVQVRTNVENEKKG